MALPKDLLLPFLVLFLVGGSLHAQSGDDRLEMARSLYQGGDTRAATALYEQVVKEFESTREEVPAAYLELAQCYRRTGDAVSEIAILGRLCELFHDSPVALKALSRIPNALHELFLGGQGLQALLDKSLRAVFASPEGDLVAILGWADSGGLALRKGDDLGHWQPKLNGLVLKGFLTSRGDPVGVIFYDTLRKVEYVVRVD